MKFFADVTARIQNSKTASRVLKWGGILLLVVAAVVIIFNYYRGFSYLSSDREMHSLGRLLTWRAECVIVFSSVWLLSLLLNKKLMVLVWLAAFYACFKMSMIVPEYCWNNAEQYCASHDCETQNYYNNHCF